MTTLICSPADMKMKYFGTQDYLFIKITNVWIKTLEHFTIFQRFGLNLSDSLCYDPRPPEVILRYVVLGYRIIMQGMRLLHFFIIFSTF